MKHKTRCAWLAVVVLKSTQYLFSKIRIYILQQLRGVGSVITFKSVKIKHHNLKGNFIRGGSEKLLLNLEKKKIVQIFVEEKFCPRIKVISEGLRVLFTFNIVWLRIYSKMKITFR